MKMQITLYCENGKYRPISSLVEVESLEDYKNNKIKYCSKGIQKICCQRYSSYAELKALGYTGLKVREYDIEKINAEKEKRKQEFLKNKQKRVDK